MLMFLINARFLGELLNRGGEGAYSNKYLSMVEGAVI